MSPLRVALVFRRLALLILLVSIVVAFAVPGCSPPDREGYVRMTNSMVPSKRSMTLGSGDIFEVRVYGEKELSGVYRVGGAGEISFPLVGRIPVEGLSPTQVETIIEQRLGDGYLKHPYVTVFVKTYNSKAISVLGQVQTPGTFPYKPDMTVIHAISLAGGMLESAKANAVVVTRQEGGQELGFTVPVRSISEGEVPNFFLKPGDIVFVQKTLL